MTVPVIMWIKALDMLMDRLRVAGLDFSNVSAISGTGQQHGTVYWKKNARKTLESLNSSRFLFEQLSNSFSLSESPIWMDSSTSLQCSEIEESVGGPTELAEITGSRAYERFSGSQIRKIYQKKPEIYQQTEAISLISSFLASLFLGNYAQMDFSDASGMNLFDIRARKWSDKCLDACAPDLISKLPEVVSSSTILGKISQYFVERYDFQPDCEIVAFTGDNPASLAGMCLGPNDVAVSLGTSDTIFISLTSEPKICLNGHVFCNPINEQHYMGLICFKNGSLTRERIRNTCSDSNWDIFNELLESTPRGNFGNLAFYYDHKEIFPVVSGDFRYNRFDQEVQNFAKEVEIRACVESQFLRLKIHAENLGFKCNANTRILATGGASSNSAIISVLADVFNAPVFTYSIPNSAVLGSALLAKFAQSKAQTTFYDMVLRLNSNFKLAAKPFQDSDEIYASLAERYRKLEANIADKHEIRN